MTRTLHTQFDGGWCDTCRIAAVTKNCPDCRQPMRPARIAVTPTDDGHAELLRRVRAAAAVEPAPGDGMWMARVAKAVRHTYPAGDRPLLIEIRDAIRLVQKQQG